MAIESRCHDFYPVMYCVVYGRYCGHLNCYRRSELRDIIIRYKKKKTTNNTIQINKYYYVAMVKYLYPFSGSVKFARQ